jgi:hypothetical protein
VLDPLGSERDAFRLLLYALAAFAVLAVLVVALRAIF